MLTAALCVGFLAPAPKQPVLAAADFLRQVEAQRASVTKWLSTQEAWTPKTAESFNQLHAQLRVAAIVRPTALLPMLVEHVSYNPVLEVIGQSRIERLESIYPVVGVLIAYDRVAVPEIIETLGSIDPKADDYQTERKRTLLIYSLRTILDGKRNGSEWTRAYIKRHADQSAQPHKSNLEGHLHHPMLSR